MAALLAAVMAVSSGIGNAELGDRASWMRGALGLMWHPTSYDIELIEQNEDWMSIEPFLDQMEEITAVDYIQINLTDAAAKSSSHTSPSPVIESFMGDVLVCPRAASGVDPFGDWLRACKDRGLRTMAYVNCRNLINGDATIAERWKEYCDTTPAVQQYINSQSYHTDAAYPDRAYMFCYAEFVLKDYSQRYGDLIDAWCFDHAVQIEISGGDANSGADLDSLRIYEAWANACRSGNPNGAVSFNHGVGWAAKPFNNSTIHADYTFGHPFGGLNNPTGTQSLYDRNFSFCETMANTDGHVYSNENKGWNSKVMGHYYPKMSTTRWNNGTVPALTNEQFLEWNEVGLSGGAISWGVPLKQPNANRPTSKPQLEAKPWAFEQLQYLEANLTVSREKYVQLRKRNALDYCINGIGAENGNNVRLYGYKPTNPNLMWEEIDRGDGYFSYKKRGTNYCLDGGNGGALNQNVYLWLEDANNYNQQWKKIPMDDGCYKLVKRNASGFGINGGGGGANNQNVHLWNSSHPSQNLHWFIEYK
ncbi:RICIN domain-containing protein [Rubritalea spongiae]